MKWNEITDYYRKRPARFKAIQYTRELLPLPPDTTEFETGEVYHKTTLLKESDWIVLDIEAEKTYILTDDVFTLVFEGV